jgi:branched-chain amino acid transport system permease protein
MKSIFFKVAAALALGGVLSQGVTSDTVLSLLTQATIYALFALGVGLLLKQNGMVSFGHATFFGCAGYAVAILLHQHVASAELVILMALAGLGLAAFLLGLVVVRVPGIAFGMLTIAIGQMFYQVASRSRSFTGGADGMSIDWPDRLFGVAIETLARHDMMFLLCWSTLVIVMGLLAALMASRFGAVTEAIRDNEERARFIGIRTLLPRAAVFALSAVVSGLGGVLSALYTGFISPEALHWSASGTALMMVVIGGYRVLWGPALGAILFFLARDLIGGYAEHWMGIFGTVLIVVIVFAPDGLSGALRRLSRRRFRAGKAVRGAALATLKPSENT